MVGISHSPCPTNKTLKLCSSKKINEQWQQTPEVRAISAAKTDVDADADAVADAVADADADAAAELSNIDH